MTKIIRAIIMFVFCTTGVVLGVEDEAIQGFLRKTEGRIAELLQTGIEAKLEKQINVRGAGKELAQQVANARFVPVGESEFRKHPFAGDKSFNYAYVCNSGAFRVNREAIARLISQPAATPQLREETSKLISDLSRGSGELIACILMNDFKQYWNLANEGAAGVRRDSRRHAYDADGRVNPVAIFGVYVEHLIRKQIPQETPLGLHEFAEQLAAAEPEYAVLSQEMKAYYPEDDFALLQMLGYEASWSAVWAMGLQCIQKLPDTNAKRLERQVNQVNRLIGKLTELKIPDEQKSYIQTKYSISKLNELAEGKVHFDSPEDAIEKEKAKAEEKRRQRVRRLCGMYADYLRLLEDNEVWYIEGEENEHLAKLVVNLKVELDCDLVEKLAELVSILDSIQDTDSAEAKIPVIVHHLLRMREIARLGEAMAMESTFRKMMDSRRAKPSFVAREYVADILQINNKSLIALSQIMERMKKKEYYNSEKLAALLQPLNWLSSGSACMGPNMELWYETRRALEGVQWFYILTGAPGRMSEPH